MSLSVRKLFTAILLGLSPASVWAAECISVAAEVVDFNLPRILRLPDLGPIHGADCDMSLQADALPIDYAAARYRFDPSSASTTVRVLHFDLIAEGSDGESLPFMAFEHHRAFGGGQHLQQRFTLSLSSGTSDRRWSGAAIETPVPVLGLHSESLPELLPVLVQKLQPQTKFALTSGVQMLPVTLIWKRQPGHSGSDISGYFGVCVGDRQRGEGQWFPIRGAHPEPEFLTFGTISLRAGPGAHSLFGHYVRRPLHLRHIVLTTKPALFLHADPCAFADGV